MGSDLARSTGARGRARSAAWRWIGRAALSLLLALAGVEAALQLAARSGSDREKVSGEARSHRILCAGDSHTYGAGVADVDSYPAQLQAQLDQRAPGQYSVVNVGVPGMNTTQVLSRLPENVSRFQPDLVVVWVGVNNSWNTSEIRRPHGPWLSSLYGLAHSSRLYRMIRVWLHDLRIQREIAPELARRQGGELRFPTETSDDGKQVIARVDPNRTVTIHWDEGVETFRFQGKYGPLDAAAAERAEADYEAMAAFAAAAGIRLAFVTYPLQVPGFQFANDAMRRVAERHGAIVIDSTRAMERLPKEKLEFVALFHPTGPLYGEIAHDLAEEILRRSP